MQIRFSGFAVAEKKACPTEGHCNVHCLRARLRQSGRVQWRDFHEYVDRRTLREEVAGRRPRGRAQRTFPGGLKADMVLVGVRVDGAEDLEGQMVSGEKHLRLGRCVRAMSDTSTLRLSQTVSNTSDPFHEIMAFSHIPKAEPQPRTA